MLPPAAGASKWLSGKESACNVEDRGDASWTLGGQNFLLQPTPVFLTGESHGQRSLEGYSPWGPKESDMTEHAHAEASRKMKKESDIKYQH